jgi:hypothetical protein
MNKFKDFETFKLDEKVQKSIKGGDNCEAGCCYMCFLAGGSNDDVVSCCVICAEFCGPAELNSN